MTISILWLKISGISHFDLRLQLLLSHLSSSGFVHRTFTPCFSILHIAYLNSTTQNYPTHFTHSISQETFCPNLLNTWMIIFISQLKIRNSPLGFSHPNLIFTILIFTYWLFLLKSHAWTFYSWCYISRTQYLKKPFAPNLLNTWMIISIS